MSDSIDSPISYKKKKKENTINANVLGSTVPENDSPVPLLDFRSLAALSIGQLPRASLIQLSIVDIGAFCIKKYSVSAFPLNRFFSSMDLIFNPCKGNFGHE